MVRAKKREHINASHGNGKHHGNREHKYTHTLV